MKKKREQRGTIEMVFAVGDHFTSFEGKSSSLDTAEIKNAVNQIITAAEVQAGFIRSYETYGYGMRIAHCSYHGRVPFDKMPDFIKAARAAGFRVKE